VANWTRWFVGDDASRAWATAIVFDRDFSLAWTANHFLDGWTWKSLDVPFAWTTKIGAFRLFAQSGVSGDFESITNRVVRRDVFLWAMSVFVYVRRLARLAEHTVVFATNLKVVELRLAIGANGQPFVLGARLWKTRRRLGDAFRLANLELVLEDSLAHVGLAAVVPD
jgi:hypothetical protein